MLTPVVLAPLVAQQQKGLRHLFFGSRNAQIPLDFKTVQF
jgi:hypothetical protein